LPKAATDEEFFAILEHVPPGRAWTRPLFEFAALTGLRIGELGRLQWRHVDRERRLIRIERQKNGKAQTQPIPRSAVAVLEEVKPIDEYVFTAPEWRRRRQLKSWCMDVQRVFREAVEAAGIQRRLTPHSLRHRYCTKLAEAGASAFVIQAAARHADVSTSQRYVSIANRSLQAELDNVFS
jgi:integrase